MSSDQVVAGVAAREPSDGFPLDESAVQRALESAAELERTLGPDHPDALNAGDSLAAAYQDAGRVADAIPLFEHVLVARQRVLGPRHADTLTSQNTLAATYRDAGRHAEAILLFKLTLAARERLLGADHPDVRAARDDLAAAEQQSAEEQAAGQESVEGAVPPGLIEPPAASSSDDAAPELISEPPVAPAAATVELPTMVPAAETGDQPPPEPEPVPEPEPGPEARQDVSELPPRVEESSAEEPSQAAVTEESRPEEPPALVAEEPSAEQRADVPPAQEPARGRQARRRWRRRGPGDRIEPAAPQDVSDLAPPAEEPATAPVAQEAPAEEPAAPFAEEPPAATAAAEPSAAPADGEEPGAVTAAEAGDQASPEPAPVPEPEPEPEPEVRQDVSEPKPLAEEPPAVAVVVEPPATEPPVSAAEEPTVAVAAAEPSAPLADREEPAAATAPETGAQEPPEPAPDPEPEPELEARPDVPEPELEARPDVPEPELEARPDVPEPTPPAEEPPQEPPAKERSAAPPNQRPWPARDHPARRRRRVLGLVAAIVIVFAGGGVAGLLTRTHAGHHAAAASRGAGSQPLSAAGQLAAVWIAQQVVRTAIVACDPLMCSALEAQGVPAANLLVLRAGTTSPLGAEVVAVTPAVRSEFGSRVSSVYAPSVIAGFGSGAGEVSVQVVAQDGPAAYLTALGQDAADRKTAGAQLLANKHILASAQARAQLAAGAVDSRLLLMLPALAAVHPIQVLAFDPAPGAGPGVPLCSADLSGSGQAANMSDVSYLRWLTSFVGTQLVPFAGSMSVLQEVGQPIVRVVFAQPSPLGLLSHP